VTTLPTWDIEKASAKWEPKDVDDACHIASGMRGGEDRLVLEQILLVEV
jgi:hypothetical protein